MTTGVLRKLNQLTFLDIPAPISSLGLPGGRSPSSSRAGHLKKKFGQVVALVSHFQPPANTRAFLMRDIYGLFGENLSGSAVLQISLGNRLAQNLDAFGSIEYVLTWKEWAMLSGPPICALRASNHRILGKDFSGWPTVTVQDGKGRDRHNQKGGGIILSLLGTARLAGWATPTARDGRGEYGSPGMMARRQNRPQGKPLSKQVIGLNARTENLGALNPELARWLMGFPAEWTNCAPTGTRSIRKSQRSS